MFCILFNFIFLLSKVFVVLDYSLDQQQMDWPSMGHSLFRRKWSDVLAIYCWLVVGRKRSREEFPPSVLLSISCTAFDHGALFFLLKQRVEEGIFNSCSTWKANLVFYRYTKTQSMVSCFTQQVKTIFMIIFDEAHYANEYTIDWRCTIVNHHIKTLKSVFILSNVYCYSLFKKCWSL